MCNRGYCKTRVVYKGKMVFLLSIFQNRAVACPKKMWYYGNIPLVLQ